MEPYDHKKIEATWQAFWAKQKLFEVRDPQDQKAGAGANRKKFYSLIEFPYPSGDGLHVGHIRSNTAMDIISHKRRREGYEVLYPIGWDAFGLPTENYAIKTGIQPAEVTKKNTDTFRRQLQSIGFSFDWSREINTTDPAYYKWTQWIFLQFLKHDLAYKKKMSINWCPKDLIGLANEEVIDGKCERCGTPVEKREKEQWMLAITKYADRLDRDLDIVDFLPQIKTQQRNWIGKSEGAEIEFTLNKAGQTGKTEQKIKVYTTRPDTLFGVTYVVLAPEHDLVGNLLSSVKNKKEVEDYIAKAKKESDINRTDAKREKTGVELKGITATNPVNNEEIPVWIADYVLADYGTGAVMAVPAHDERDFAFAKKYGLPFLVVIKQEWDFEGVTQEKNYKILDEIIDFCTTENIKHILIGGIAKTLAGYGTGKNCDVDLFILGDGYEKVKTYLLSKKFNLEDHSKNSFGWDDMVALFNDDYWVDICKLNKDEKGYFDMLSKKRFDWGNDDSIFETITTDKNKKILIPNKTLLSKIYQNMASSCNRCFTDYGILVNSSNFTGKKSKEIMKEITEFASGTWVTKFKLRDWVFSRQRYWGEPIPVVHCEKCGIVPLPESELPLELPKVENYKPTETGESPLATISDWVNTKCPKCGGAAKRETDTMPNWAGSSWYYLRYVDPHNTEAFASPEKLKYWTPVDWYNGGMEHTTLHLLYSRFWHKFLFDIGLVPTIEPYQKRTSHGLILAKGGEKMSKSKGNVVNPDGIVAIMGADALRLYEMFMGPFDQAIAWDENGIVGCRRFVERVWKLGDKIQLSKQTGDDKNLINSAAEILINKTIKKVTEDIEAMRFNTAVSTLMIAINEFEKEGDAGAAISREHYETFLSLLAPFAPHVTEEIWQRMFRKTAAAADSKTPPLVSIHQLSWPIFDPTKIKDATVTIPIQINGKTRATIVMSPEATEDEVKNMALSMPEIQKWLEIGQGKATESTKKLNIKKVIYVNGRLLNIVIDLTSRQQNDTTST